MKLFWIACRKKSATVHDEPGSSPVCGSHLCHTVPLSFQGQKAPWQQPLSSAVVVQLVLKNNLTRAPVP